MLNSYYSYACTQFKFLLINNKHHNFPKWGPFLCRVVCAATTHKGHINNYSNSIFCGAVVIPRANTWWDWFRVFGKPKWGPLYSPHKHLHPRQRQQGATVLSLVRPHQKLPHLLYHLEAPAHHVSHNKQILKKIHIFFISKYSIH